MKSRRTAFWLGAAISSLLVGFGGLQYLQLVATKAELRLLLQRRDRIRIELGLVKREIASERIHYARSEHGQLTESRATKSIAARLKLDRRVMIASNPALRAAWLASTKASIDFEYGWLFQRIGLTTAQIDRFKAILVSGKEGELDLALSAANQGISWSDSSLNGLKKTTGDMAIAQPMIELLGPDYAAFQSYRNELPAWQLVGQVTALSAYDSLPLNDAQSAALEKLFSASSSHSSDGSVIANTVQWNAVLPAAATILNSSQYQHLELLGQANMVSMNLDQSLKALLGP